MLKYPCNSYKVDAHYTQQRRAFYRDNPWIEALPDNPDDRQLFHSLLGGIAYDSSERDLPTYERIECIQGLAHVFVPFGQCGDIARKVASAIREGYVTRNPTKGQWNQSMGRLQGCVQSRDTEFLALSGSNANACGFCIVGDSGMGKTSAVNHALALFPQSIIHNSYQKLPFPNLQIVWMRLECPHDASVKGLCTEFFVEFDKITNDNTYAKYASGGRATTDQMIPQMALVAQRHGLGLLVIDEIQNLNSAKSGGAERMLNFIVQLVNTIGIPVLLAGTPPAFDILTSNLMTARRSSGQQGLTRLAPLEKDSSDWYLFVKGIWKYQWTAERTELSEELRDTLHVLSKGNIDAVVKLYMEAQRVAIRHGQRGEGELITPEVMKEAADGDAFKLVLNILARERGEIISDSKSSKIIKTKKSHSADIPRNEVLQRVVSIPSNYTDEFVSLNTDLNNNDFLQHLKDIGMRVSRDDAF